jgi:hypothetical protein
MLIRWISTGYLVDPFDEFMVKESGHITKGVLESDYTDEYWERRYTVSVMPELHSVHCTDDFSSETAHRLQLHPRCPPENLHLHFPPGYLHRDLTRPAYPVAPAFPPSFSPGSTKFCSQGNTSMSSGNAVSR